MLRPLEKLPPGRALEFLHKIIDGICGRAYPRYQDYGSIWSLSEWMEVLEEARTYFKTAVGKNIPDEELALSSDKISMLQMPLLNLDLDVRENGEIKPISIEMNKEELQNLISTLEAADKISKLERSTAGCSFKTGTDLTSEGSQQRIDHSSFLKWVVPSSEKPW
ncbi:COMM domain-containing protein 8 isoform X3 [Apus apus]|uniref:COMM domain-containing protein 8 isoform X3 n=1 Tax=Apus apus TaxID=8895 RepID=UPI0021F8221E|nr:COMM domain-containing protein 8 isoform X3 [Apus apus]